MTPTRQGSIRLFQVAGINVFLHWSWFLVAAYAVTMRRAQYSSMMWNLFEYLALFLIVLLHEFGHALACRQTGGEASQIVLWPLGGVAYVAPPQRPGATLWSIVAGPLVNVALVPILCVPFLAARAWGWPADVAKLAEMVFIINGGLLVFNLLPVYPLDGGQILRSLLWFILGRARSLMVTCLIGFGGVAVLIGIAIWIRDPWAGIMCAFIVVNCWGGLQQARVLAQIAKLPRRAGLACPSCGVAPPLGAYWGCGKCRVAFDTFVTLGRCPQCGDGFPVTRCLDCGASRSMSEWMQSPPPLPGTLGS